MTQQQYQRERARLLEVLMDAIDRGDYHLEMDVREMLETLKDRLTRRNCEDHVHPKSPEHDH